MSWKSVRDLASLLPAALDGLETIDALADSSNHSGSIEAIKAVIATLRSGFEGNVSAADVHAGLATLRKVIAKNDLDADAALKAKFPGG